MLLQITERSLRRIGVYRISKSSVGTMYGTPGNEKWHDENHPKNDKAVPIRTKFADNCFKVFVLLTLLQIIEKQASHSMLLQMHYE
jgi:hypothetical protein